MPYPYYQQTAYQPQYQQYFPVGYQPVQPPVQQTPAQQMQSPQTQSYQAYQSPVNASGILWVDGDMDASSFPIAPNTAVRLWHKTKPIVYFKEADAAGKPTLKKYDLVEHVDTAQDANENGNAKTVPFATKEELGVVVGAVKEYSEALNKINADLETMRGDLYGAVGKRRAVKRQQEAADDDE